MNDELLFEQRRSRESSNTFSLMYKGQELGRFECQLTKGPEGELYTLTSVNLKPVRRFCCSITPPQPVSLLDIKNEAIAKYATTIGIDQSSLERKLSHIFGVTDFKFDRIYNAETEAYDLTFPYKQVSVVISTKKDKSGIPYLAISIGNFNIINLKKVTSNEEVSEAKNKLKEALTIYSEFFRLIHMHLPNLADVLIKFP